MFLRVFDDTSKNVKVTFFLNFEKKVKNVFSNYEFRDSSFWQYKVYAGIRRGSPERKHQTTVGSSVKPSL